MTGGAKTSADTTETLPPPPVPVPKRTAVSESAPTSNNNRMHDLEQRLRWVEDEIHQLSDKTRELERRVDDLRERQNSRL